MTMIMYNNILVTNSTISFLLAGVGSGIMATYKQYDSIDELTRRYRKRVQTQMFDGEEFVKAIDTKAGRIRSKHNEKLVLTDQRILRVAAGVVRSTTEDYSISEITSIEFNRGVRKSKLTIQGAAIDESFPTTKRHGETFATEARKQLAESPSQN